VPSHYVSETESPTETDAPPLWRFLLTALATAVVIALVAAVLVFVLRDDMPGEASADAGFARDMSTHHDQAVQMAAMVYRRSDDPILQSLAYDILTSQQAQIGIMAGWLQVWGLSFTGQDLPMAWMGHPMTGPMPGMASDEEIAALETLPPAEMDREFLRLMIRHHQGGVEMAVAGLERADEKIVRDLARAIASAQQTEITTMERLLAERTGPS